MSNKQKTAMQELIDEFEDIKKNKCKTLQEVMFFDGVLAIIEGKYLQKERQQIIDFHVACVDHGAIEEGESVTEQDKGWIKNHAEQYYNKTYGHEITIH